MIQLFCLMVFKIFLVIALMLFNLFDSISQDNNSILTNVDIQIEATAAINKMYNFEFEDAEKEFNWLVQEYSNHPLPVFLKGLSLWWRIDSYSGISNLSKIDSLERLDSKFIDLMDKTISLSKSIYDKGNKIDGAFFLAASYGFKGRLLSERRKWRASAFAGMNALKYLKEIRKLCDRHNVILIFDELQTGIGRTGKMFAFENYKIVPDILVIGKALGGGFPIGALISDRKLLSKFISNPELGHITTFGGHPVIASAGLKTLQIILREKLHLKTIEKEKIFRNRLKHKLIEEIRGSGLMLCLIMKNSSIASQLVSESLNKGLILFFLLYEKRAVRITPPLTISENEINQGCDIIIQCLKKIN